MSDNNLCNRVCVCVYIFLHFEMRIKYKLISHSFSSFFSFSDFYIMHFVNG